MPRSPAPDGKLKVSHTVLFFSLSATGSHLLLTHTLHAGLMEEKGLEHDGSKKDSSKPAASSTNSTPKKDKPSLSQRIKAKFHKKDGKE